MTNRWDPGEETGRRCGPLVSLTTWHDSYPVGPSPSYPFPVQPSPSTPSRPFPSLLFWSRSRSYSPVPPKVDTGGKRRGGTTLGRSGEGRLTGVGPQRERGPEPLGTEGGRPFYGHPVLSPNLGGVKEKVQEPVTGPGLKTGPLDSLKDFRNLNYPSRQ